MKAGFSTSLHCGFLATFCFVLGCPQLADDEFSTLDAVAGSAGALGQGGVGGVGGTSTPGPGGAGGSAACVPGSPRNCPTNGGSSPVIDAATPPGCAADEREGPGRRCYVAQARELTWQAARASCQARGAAWDLATIRDQADNDFVHGLAGYEAWLAGTDATREATWVWVTDETEFYPAASAPVSVYTNWNVGEPNNNNDSDCLRMLITGVWADLECDSLKGSVCAGEAR